jgi:DNA-binding response OmpR family regulator
MKILIYTPKPEEEKPLRRVAEHYNIKVDSCTVAERMLACVKMGRYAAVLVRGVSFSDLHELLITWKENGFQEKTRIIVLTYDPVVLHRAVILELGADEYLIEPHSYTVLISNILLAEYKKENVVSQRFSTANFEIDMLQRAVWYKGDLLVLTKTEFEMLSFFIRCRGMVLSRLQIWEEVWGYEEYPLANTVDVHMNRLRKKLPENAKRLISTVYGMGYRMHPEA